MSEKLRSYLKESRKVSMSPKQIADTYGKEIMKSFGKKSASKESELAVFVYEYLLDMGGAFRNLAEGMSDEDLKETAKEIMRKYG